MSPVLRRRSTATVSGTVLALALGLTGCGSGLKAQTYQERATADATNEAIGALAVRNVSVLPPRDADTYPVGSDARVTLTVVNEGDQPDRLVSATTDAATSVAVAAANGTATSLSVPAQGEAAGYTLVLRGLTRELRPGTYITLTLSFQVNGSEQFLVPVAVTGSPAPSSTYKPADTDSAGNVLQENGTDAGTNTAPEG